MHFRRLACLLLGAWLAGSIFMTMVATQNFRAVDRLLNRPAPAAAEQVKTMGHDAARALLRYQVAELNRFYFEAWEIAQLGLGFSLFLVLLFGSSESKFTLLLALLMFALVVIQRLLLTPEIVALGRTIDFLPPSAPSQERTRFWFLHGAYSIMEVLKIGLGLILAVKLLRRTTRRRSDKPGRDVHVVDETDHGHVDG